MSYRYLKNEKKSVRTNRSTFSLLIALLSIVSFCATTVPRRAVKADISVNRTFLLPKSKATVLSQLNEGHTLGNTLSENLADTLFYVYFDIPDYSASATAVAVVKPLGKDTTVIYLRDVTQYKVEGPFGIGVNQNNVDACAALTPMDFAKYFEKYYVDVISYSMYQKITGQRLYFDNKKRLDEIVGEDYYP